MKEFGKNGLFLLDHAWGQEPCTISQARNYKRHGRSISNGQVLMRDYQFSEAQTLIREMALASCLELTEKGLAATGVGLIRIEAHDVGTEVEIVIEDDGDGQVTALFNNRKCFGDGAEYQEDTVLIFHVEEEGGRPVIDDIYPVVNGNSGSSIKDELKTIAADR